MTGYRLVRRIYLWAVMAGLLSLGAAAQSPRYTLFGGALLGAPNGFTLGVGLALPINRNVSFEPSVAGGRSGHAGLFTADGVFTYAFHLDDEAFVPYILGGVGLAQWGSASHGSAIAGFGVRFPIGNDAWITPEVRAGSHGLARFTIGYSKSF